VSVRVPEAPTLLVVAVVATGLALVHLRDWRTGAVVIAAGVLLAAVLRLVLPVRQAGWLVVRAKYVDITLLGLAGTALLLLAVTIPEARA
jgi:hypothetical protein